MATVSGSPAALAWATQGNIPGGSCAADVPPSIKRTLGRSASQSYAVLCVVMHGVTMSCLQGQMSYDTTQLLTGFRPSIPGGMPRHSHMEKATSV